MQVIIMHYMLCMRQVPPHRTEPMKVLCKHNARFTDAKLDRQYIDIAGRVR